MPLSRSRSCRKRPPAGTQEISQHPRAPRPSSTLIKGGVLIQRRQEKARMAFLLLTPAESPRLHIRLLSRTAALVESE